MRSMFRPFSYSSQSPAGQSPAAGTAFDRRRGRRSATRTAAAATTAAMCGVERLEGRLFMTVTPDPGSTFATAYNVGDPGGGITFSDHIGATDPVDFYSFNVSAPGVFHGRVRAYEANTELTVYKNAGTASNPNYQLLGFGVAEPPSSGDPNNFDSGNININVTPGQYFFKVADIAGDSDYLVRFTTDYAGDTLQTARPVGNLVHSVFHDEVGDSFDGTGGDNSYNDPFDYYKLTLTKPAKLTTDIEFNGAFTQPTFNARAVIIHDGNNNGHTDPGEELGAAHIAQPNYLQLPAGTYYIEVDPQGTPYPNYTLTLDADYAGDTLATANNLGDLTNAPSTATAQDYLTTASTYNPDKTDLYTFTVTQPRQVVTSFNGFANGGTGGAFTVYQDKNHDGFLEPNEALSATSSTPTPFAQTVTDVQPGRYYVLVTPGINGSSGFYSLTVNAAADKGGNSLNTATNLGTGGGKNSLISIADVVTNVDKEDIYKFILPYIGTVHATLSPYYGGDTNLQLIQDKNHNGVIDPGEVIAASFNPGSTPDDIFKGLGAGTYFLRVVHTPSTPGTLYNLTVVTDTVGNTIPTARDLGVLTGKTISQDDYIQQNYGLGSDTNDFYKFTLTQAGAFSAKTTGTPGEDFDIQLILDKNHNGIIDPGEVLGVSSNKNSPFETITKSSLAAGTYYLRVYGINGDTNYNLTLHA